MITSKHFKTVLAGILLGSAAPLSAQLPGFVSSEEVKLPPPPAARVFDDAGLFARHPDRLKTISYRLLAFEKAHGIPIYLAVYPALFSNDATKQAQYLYDAWVGEGRDGIVVVCDTDTREIELGLPPHSFGADPAREFAMTRLPDHLLLPIMRDLRAELDAGGDRIDYLDELTEILTTRLGASLEQPAGLSGSSTLKFVAVTAAALCVLGLLGFLGNRYLRAAEVRAKTRFYFPEVQVGSRLDAPYGGGRVSEVEFSDGDSSRGGEG